MRERTVWLPTADEKERCIKLAEYMIENHSTVRATAKHFGISKSTVHKDVAEKLPQKESAFVRDLALYHKAKLVLDKNKAERHIRGGQATKDKYSTMQQGKGK